MIPAKLHRSFWLLCLLPFLLPAAASGQTLTVDDLAQKLDETCEKAPEKIPTEPSGSDWWSTKCEKQDSQPVDVAVCRSELLKLWRPKLEASQEEVIEELKNSGNTIRSMKIEPASLATDLSRHLRLLRAEVESTLLQEIAALDLSTFEPGDQPQESGKAAWKKIATGLRRAAKRACELAASDTVDDAEILLTEARMATEARVKTAAALKSAEQEHFEELSGKKQNGFAQVVDCKWTPGDDVNPPTLVCSSGVLLSGEEPSVIRITGLDPRREFTVTARSAEEVVPAAPHLTGMGIAPTVRETLCPEEVGTTPKRRLSCDQLSVVELPRFRGHVILLGGEGRVHDAEDEAALCAGVPAPDGGAGTRRPDAGGAVSGVRAVGADDP